MKNGAAVLCGAILLAWACGVAMTAPKPSETPSSWQLDFTYKQPLPIRVEIPGQKAPVTFWYLPYTVTNQTGNDQMFVPEFVLYADTGQLLQAGKDVPSVVFRTIKEQMNEPLLQDTADISGKLLRGANNAKQGVMIFTDIDPKAGSFDIFVGGLSGETAKVVPPSPVPTARFIMGNVKDSNKVVEMKTEIVLRKTLQLHYLLPGEASSRFQNLAKLDSKTWVMR